MATDDRHQRLADDAMAAGRDAGLDAVGIASAEPFEDVERILEERKAAGLHGGMAFTYRNPKRSTTPSMTLPNAAALVVGARSYHREAPVAPSPTHGAVARYSWEDHYAPLRQALETVAGVLRAHGFDARVLVDDNALVDRAAAHRAGLGWYGKNANLLLPGMGSWFVLGSVVTDAPLPPTSRATNDGCGTCDRCIPACPTGAIVAPGVIDARRCLAWLLEAEGTFPREHREALRGRIYGCDDCQEACPPNRLAIKRKPSPTASADAEPTVDLVAMLESTDDDLMHRFGRWYIAARDAAYVRRNALVAIGNVGDPTDERTRRAVTNALADERDVVRAHAVWAAARLGGFDAELDRRAAAETAPAVLAELGARPAPRTG